MSSGQSNLLKTAARWLGVFATVAACCFVVYGLFKTRALSAIDWTTPATWRMLLGASLAYAAAQIFQIMSWRTLLNDVSSRPLSHREAFHVYSVSAIYKYLPSNVLHHVGRYAMLRARGVDQFAIVWAAGFEAILMILVSTLIAVAFGWSLLMIGAASLPSSWMNWDNLGAIVLLGVLLGGVAGWFARARIRKLFAAVSPRRAARGFLTASVGYVVFFVLAGLIAYALLGMIATSTTGVSALQIIAIISCAWVLGFVTPGASAGVGVRETIIAVTLGSLTSFETGLALGVAYRIVTLSGDLLLALVGLLLADRRGPARADVGQEPSAGS